VCTIAIASADERQSGHDHHKDGERDGKTGAIRATRNSSAGMTAGAK